MTKPKNLLTIIALFSVLALASCSFPGVYKIPIGQGNTLDDDKVAQLEVGQTMSQVKFLLGTPMLADPLSPRRWDYLYSLTRGDKIYRDVHLVVYFDDTAKVKKIDKIRNELYPGGKTLEEIPELKKEKQTTDNPAKPQQEKQRQAVN